MKKIASISLAGIFLLSTGNLIVATHFCHGAIAQMKIVVGHGKATCGMEKGTNNCAGGKGINKDCCKDVLQAISIKDTYTPSFLTPVFKINSAAVHYLIVNFSIPAHDVSFHFSAKSLTGIFSVFLPFIQVFRF